MLQTLTIRDFVLIDRLALAFGRGLAVLTGETGAGKSILLDALGLALGARGEGAGVVRQGATQASVVAEFDLPSPHAARVLLDEQGIARADTLVLRRVVGLDGRSRAFINDEPVSVGLLRQVGDTLVEIQGQSAEHGLLEPASHGALLDSFAKLGEHLAECRAGWLAWQDASRARSEAAAELAAARRDEDYLRHALDGLTRLAPEVGEDASLSLTRQRLMARGKIQEALHSATAELTQGRGASSALRTAERHIARVADRAGGQLDQALAALGRAAIEAEEAEAELGQLGQRLDSGEDGLAAVDERLFQLRAEARKHNTSVDALPALCESMAATLAQLQGDNDRLAGLTQGEAAARGAYIRAAEALGALRRKTATAFDRRVMAELAPLHLERARFATRIEALEESHWRADGRERIAFEVATIPGLAPGPLARVASGGELARLMLALRVVLAAKGSAPTLVFDEVDTGVGGAVAAAVGERLARLAEQVQVLVVTHSPQVAALGNDHWRVVKSNARNAVETRVEALDDTARQEEIARMLSGRQVTDAARAAALSLMRRRGLP
ncbi:MAG: DNA repair protein RecN [Alphaproteobacteria bacterium]|nr:DNA repair protein RecN [Alphaproteobacteria bacterium]